ncbi:MAG: hypothetical protein Q7O66_07310 [Dehalococcoidia bacterium]|nr:hypothetical protein [Dehalococcoidia bacterium]
MTLVIIADRREEDIIAITAAMRVRERQRSGPTEEELHWREAELDRCRTDILYWIDNYCWGFDNRLPVGEQEFKFKLYDFQGPYVLWLEERYRRHLDGLTEKSRDMGVTWLNLYWDTHHWLFDGMFQALLGSRKEEMVDNNQMDSHFGRLDFVIEHLPDWMKPAGYDRKKNRTFLKIYNPATGALLEGESANKKFGRQGRYNVLYLDEAAFIPDFKIIWAGTADSSPCRIAVSTPNPYEASGLDFEHLKDGGKVPVYTIHWRSHPKKDDAWLENERTRRTDEEIAVEIEISYQVALTGRVYGEWDSLPHGDFPYRDGWPLYCVWDYGVDDDTAMIWAQRNPVSGKFRIVDRYHNNGRAIDFYIPWVTGQVASGLPYEYTEADLNQIARHSAWPMGVHFGDPAGHQRNPVTGTSVIHALGLAQIIVNTKADTNTFEKRHRETQMFMRRIEGINMPACQALDDAMRHARYPKRDEGGQETGERRAPVHDWTAHYRSGIEYLAVNAPKIIVGAKKQGRRKSSWERM